MTSYYYTPIPVNAISDSLTAAFQGMEQDGGKFMRAANINSIIVTQPEYCSEQLEELVYILSLVHPNRCFVIFIDEKVADVEAKFSARCHSISSKEHVCSEIVQLFASPKQLPAICNVLRSNLLTGQPSELVLLDPKVAQLGSSTFSSICEQSIFSSALFADRLPVVQDLCAIEGGGIDLEWIKLGIWRDQVKDIFANLLWRNYLSRLKSIQIESSITADSKIEVPTSSLLMAGWFIGQLGLIIDRVADNEIQCHSSIRNSVTISLKVGQFIAGKGSNNGVLSKLTMNFHETEQVACGNITIERKDELESNIFLGGNFRIVRSFDDETLSGLLKRYFLIGEATSNYSRSLDNAIKIFNTL